MVNPFICNESCFSLPAHSVLKVSFSKIMSFCIQTVISERLVKTSLEQLGGFHQNSQLFIRAPHFKNSSDIFIPLQILACEDPEGDRWSGTPGKLQKYRVSLAILVQIPLKSQSYQSSIQCWTIIGLPAKSHLDKYLDPFSPHQTSKTQSWTPSDKTFWIRACLVCHCNRRGALKISL